MKNENNILTITGKHYCAAIAEKGAELRSLRRLSDGKEFIWQRDEKFWEDSSPMLFPICGRLNGARYRYGDTEYHMGIHGFLTSLCPYETKVEDGRAVLCFRDDAQTYEQYPFHFSLTVTYTLSDTGIFCEMDLENLDEKMMYYSMGSHPGIVLPLREGAPLEEHCVVYPKAEDVHQVMIDDDGMFTGELPAYTLPEKTLALSESQFEIDGVFLNGMGEDMELHCKGADFYVRVRSAESRVFGLWKEYGADAKFLCMEPWSGYPSIAGQNDRLEEKFGMDTLPSGEKGRFTFAIDVLAE